MTAINQLRLYVNPKWRRKGIHTPLLNPWWGNPHEEASIFSKLMFDSYSFDTSLYVVTDDVSTAEMVLPPYPHQWFLRHDTELFDECVKIASECNLPILIDGLGDIEHPIEVKNAYILRYGGYHFLPERGRIVVPLHVDDLLERCCGGRFDVRKKKVGKPIIGFAGWTELSFSQYLRTIIKELPVRLLGVFDTRYRACTKGILWRQKTIKILQKSGQVRLNLRTRRSFSASPKTAEGDMKKLREEMVDVILQSDYALDVRGDANNSARLFEILSLGRIPIIVDTERNFPFSDKIDYASFAVMIDFRELNNLPSRIAEFHDNISPEHFEQMQKNAREVFVRYFRIDAIMRSLVEDLHTRISSGAGSLQGETNRP
ncbi:exostosin family protein [Candidatus Nomurabacteria bacterium]|nr:exostosin family protein [Candidatus Nomurabacteria bacterium]